ncbi:MAG: transposase family protein [Trichodesmium sp. MAG_R04]|nr:transposase family protein [Trichodesmium sp. MAG_R04]
MLEQFQKKEDEYLWIQEILTEQELIVDITEKSIYRPYADDKNKKYYSGKNKNYTLKNKIITTEKGTEIVDLIVGKRGPESDVNLLIKKQKKFDKEQKFQEDKGYQGVQRTMIQKKA